MATPIKPKGPRGRKRTTRKKPPKARRPPGPEGLKEVVHLIGTGPKALQFTFSQDVVERLMDLHDQRFHPLIYTPRQQRMRRIRVQFVRLTDLGIPGVMIMIEPPTYDPRGHLLRRNGRRYTTAIVAHALGFKARLPRRNPFWYWADNMQGLIINLDDDDMTGDPPPKPKPGDPLDLVARRDPGRKPSERNQR